MDDKTGVIIGAVQYFVICSRSRKHSHSGLVSEIRSPIISGNRVANVHICEAIEFSTKK